MATLGFALQGLTSQGTEEVGLGPEQKALHSTPYPPVLNKQPMSSERNVKGEKLMTRGKGVEQEQIRKTL
jgi:hypothetical protein